MNIFRLLLQTDGSDNPQVQSVSIFRHKDILEMQPLFPKLQYEGWTVPQTDLPVHGRFPMHIFQIDIFLSYPYKPDNFFYQYFVITVLNRLLISCHFFFLLSISISLIPLHINVFCFLLPVFTNLQSLLCGESLAKTSAINLVS